MISNILIFLAITIPISLVGYYLIRWMPISSGRFGVVRIIEAICRLSLAGVFLYAAYEKVLDPLSFASDIYAYRIMPVSLSVIMAITMPVLEVLGAVVILAGFAGRRFDTLLVGASTLIGAMLLVFVVAIYQAILRGIDIHCGCFGDSSHKVDFQLIAQDELLLVCVLFLLRLAYHRWRTERGLTT